MAADHTQSDGESLTPSGSTATYHDARVSSRQSGGTTSSDGSASSDGSDSSQTTSPSAEELEPTTDGETALYDYAVNDFNTRSAGASYAYFASSFEDAQAHIEEAAAAVVSTQTFAIIYYPAYSEQTYSLPDTINSLESGYVSSEAGGLAYYYNKFYPSLAAITSTPTE